MATVGTPGLGYPLLLCLGKSLVVILNYALTAEQPDPCGPEPYSPGKWPQTRSPLGEGPVTPRVQKGGSPPPKPLGAPDPRRVRDPHILFGPLSGWNRHPAWVRSRHVSAGAGTRRYRLASTGRLAYLPHSMQ